MSEVVPVAEPVTCFLHVYLRGGQILVLDRVVHYEATRTAGGDGVYLHVVQAASARNRLQAYNPDEIAAVVQVGP